MLLHRRFTYHPRLLLHDEYHQKCCFVDGHAGSEYQRVLSECDVISATNFISFWVVYNEQNRQGSLLESMRIGFSDSHPTQYVVHGRAELLAANYSDVTICCRPGDHENGNKYQSPASLPCSGFSSQGKAKLRVFRGATVRKSTQLSSSLTWKPCSFENAFVT